MLDGFAMSALEGRTERYGEVRVWCAVSYGLGSLIMGFVTDAFHNNFAPNFIIYLAFTVIFVLVNVWQVPNKTEDEKKIKGSELHLANFVCTMLKLKNIAFFTEVFVFGIGVTVVERLLFIYLQSELGASTTLCGLVVGVTVTLEIPVFLCSKWLLQHVGFDLLILSAQTAYIVRVIGYTLLTPETVWWVLACEALHGFTFACFWIAAVEHVKGISPPGWTSTGQTMLVGAYYGLACAVGAPIGGWILQHYGGKYL